MSLRPHLLFPKKDLERSKDIFLKLSLHFSPDPAINFLGHWPLHCGLPMCDKEVFVNSYIPLSKMIPWNQKRWQNPLVNLIVKSNMFSKQTSRTPGYCFHLQYLQKYENIYRTYLDSGFLSTTQGIKPCGTSLAFKTSEILITKSHQHDCLYMSWAKTIDMSKWMGKLTRPQPTYRMQAAKGMLRVGEINLSQAGAHKFQMLSLYVHTYDMSNFCK